MREVTIKFYQFKRVIGFVSQLMRIDRQYFISHMAWTKHKVFEMSELFVGTTMLKVSRKHYRVLQARNDKIADAVWSQLESKAGEDMDTRPAQLDLLKEAFDMNDFAKFCYNAHIV